MRVAMPLFDNLTALDAIGPYEVLSRIPGAEVTFVGAEARAYVGEHGTLRLHAEATLDEVPQPDIVCVPGGPGVMRQLDGPLVPWIRAAHETTTWTTSVCTGALLLGAAGVLRGLRANTHWLARDKLASFGAIPTNERVVEDGKVITAAGVSSGIDMALVFAARIAGEEVAQAIQLSVEYDPQPPFDAGTPEKAPGPIQDMVRAALVERDARIAQRAAARAS
jgi:putative intracellular protease/amidase